MKKLINLKLVIIIIFCFSCNENAFFDEQAPILEEELSDLSAARKAAPYNNILLLDPRFSSSVFYDNISAPDGIHLLNKNKLLVTKERFDDVGIYLAKRGTSYDIRDAYSTLNAPFVSPDDIIADENGVLYVADGEAFTVFKINKGGGSPIPFLTDAEIPSLNPYGVTIAPPGFDGLNVDPGDLLVCNNAGGNSSDWGVYAVNRTNGTVKLIAGEPVFKKPPVKAAFNSEGTLYVSLNFRPYEDYDCYSQIVKLEADGTVTLIKDGLYSPFFAIHPLTNDIYYKTFIRDDDKDCDNFAPGVGQIYRMSKEGLGSTLFATNVGSFRAGTQDMVFNKQGTSLYISHRNDAKVIEIYSKKSNW